MNKAEKVVKVLEAMISDSFYLIKHTNIDDKHKESLYHETGAYRSVINLLTDDTHLEMMMTILGIKNED